MPPQSFGSGMCRPPRQTKPASIGNGYDAGASRLGEMEQYRVYVLDADGHVHDPPQVIECPDDEAAIEQARQLLNGRVIEVWHGSRRVISLAPTRPSSPIVGLPKDDPNEFKLRSVSALIDPYVYCVAGPRTNSCGTAAYTKAVRTIDLRRALSERPFINAVLDLDRSSEGLV